jgi:putative membrane protein insertion efficiency factor
MVPAALGLRCPPPTPRIGRMVFIWSSGWGPRRRRHGPGYGRRYGPRYGYGPGYGYGPRRGHDRDGSCLRDLLFLNTGCCLANAIGCGIDGLFLVPTTVRHVHATGTGRRGTRVRDRLVAAVRVYQREVSPRRPPCCRFEPTCSAYAVQALERHGAGRGGWLTLRRLVRCRPGAAGGPDPVPAAA